MQQFPSVGSADEWLTIKFRYKHPGDTRSNLIVKTLAGKPAAAGSVSDNFKWAAAVAGFGMLLTDSPYVNDWNFDAVLSLAENARGNDREGYRSEFINMVKTYGLIARSNR
jgi:Ca-activated chloride channel family protein